MHILLIAGARPNFMKVAPLYHRSMGLDAVRCRIVHTGQHYDYAMSQAFFDDLELPEPPFYLGAGSGTHAEQTARIMTAFEALCLREKPELVVVVGDVNSTLACAIVAKKAMVPVAHVEAGLRSFDRSMPEEINRIVTDAVSDYFFVSEQSGCRNLLAEGQPPERIHWVGNVMVDNLLSQLHRLNNGNASHFASAAIKERHAAYAFLTLHRPSNVDSRDALAEIVSALNEIAEVLPIVFPVHPRTRQKLAAFDLDLSDGIELLEPLGFRESLFLWKDARFVLTDSGGLQEETTALGIPCVTIRENTERPITVELGTNVLGGTRRESIIAAVQESLVKARTAKVPPLWDGKAAERFWSIVCQTA